MDPVPPVSHLPGRPPFSWPALIAWLVIAGCVALAVQRAPRHEADADGQPGARLRLVLLSRYAVGFTRLAPATAAGQRAQLIADLDDAASSDAQRLQLVPVVGEVVDRDAAIQRLERLEALDLGGPLAECRRMLRAIYADPAPGPASLSDEERRLLGEQLGWPGELALVHGLPEDHPRRREVLAPAMRTVYGALALAMTGGTALLAGLALLLATIVALARGRAAGAYDALARCLPTSAFIEVFALYLAGFLVFGLLIGLLVGKAPLSAIWLFVAFIPCLLAWLRMRRVPWSGIRAALGWHRGQGWWREIGAGLAGYLVALPVLAVGAWIASRIGTPHHPIIDEISGGASVLALYAAAVVFAPLVEETMFRGALYHHLRCRHGRLLAALASAGLFAAIHPQGLAGLPTLTGLALVFAGLREWRGSIIAPTVAHACNNAVSVSLLVLMGG